MKILSVFSGVGGMDLGLEQAGHEIVAMCEIDAKARGVLARHWPDIPIHDDITTLNGEHYNGKIDAIAGGSPCQDLSVAGNRHGLDGQRSGLFWHQVRVADQAAAKWFIWENVPGALTSNKGADFAAVLWGITGTLPELPPQGRWQNSGMVVGPKRSAIWRVLDAQAFGVPQRRRRIFLVAGPTDECRPEILFESQNLSRYSQTDTSQKQEASPATSTGTSEHGATYWDGTQTSDTIDVSMASKGQMLPEKRRMFAVLTPSIGFNWQNGGGYNNANDGLAITIEGTGPLSTSQKPAVTQTHNNNLIARRITPTECERLMGWPDNWTQYDNTEKQNSDTTRYKMCGNGVVAPVTKWIGQKLPQKTPKL